MSNNKEDKNFTQIPNIVFEYWMAELSLAQFKVFLCICRKLYGWHKTQDKISISQIMKMTGLSKRAIIKIINELVEIDLIIAIKSKEAVGDKACTEFLIQEKVMNRGSDPKSLPSDPKSPQVVTQSHYRGDPKSPPGGDPKSPPGGDPKSPTKERPNKRNYTKETTTTTKVVADVSFIENWECATRLHDILIKDVKRLKWSENWLISKDILTCLMEKHGQQFVCDQLNYMISQEQKHLNTKKEILIKDPPTYIKKACEENWASSLIHKEKQ